MMPHGECVALYLVVLIFRLRESVNNLGQLIINYKLRVREFVFNKKNTEGVSLVV